jgi:hypothetical protein
LLPLPRERVGVREFRILFSSHSLAIAKIIPHDAMMGDVLPEIMLPEIMLPEMRRTELPFNFCARET